LRNGERKPIVAIPPIAGLVKVRVQPATIAIAVRAKEVRIAIGITRDIVCATAPRILSGLNRIRHRNALISRAKYLLF
jgi:hypothetical protein